MVKAIILNKYFFLLIQIENIRNIIKDLYGINTSLYISGKGELW